VYERMVYKDLFAPVKFITGTRRPLELIIRAGDGTQAESAMSGHNQLGTGLTRYTVLAALIADGRLGLFAKAKSGTHHRPIY
jgi:hypothetical protein